MLNFALIDDNKKLLGEMCHILESIFIQYNYDAEIGVQTSDAEEFLNYVSNNKTDVLLLDINLNSSITGMQIAEKVRKADKDCYIIFETAHLEYSLFAYKYKTFDFIPKPITRDKLKSCILRLFEDISGSNKKFIKINNKNTIISENEIKYIKKDGMKLIFHTDHRDYEIYSSFSKIQEKLPNNFVRCHKSFIANIYNISQIDGIDNVVFFTNSSCDIGPKYKNNFLEMVNKYGNIR